MPHCAVQALPRPATRSCRQHAPPSCTAERHSRILPVTQALLPQARLPLGVTMEGGASDQGFTMGGGPTPDNQGYTVSAPTPDRAPRRAHADRPPQGPH